MSDVPAPVSPPPPKPRLPRVALLVLFALPFLLAAAVLGAGLKAMEWLHPPKAAATEFAHAGTDPDGGQLYNHHCARCHGVSGDGVGDTPMFPKARHFGYERFKFTDTLNGRKQPQGAAGTLGGIPTDEVLAGVIRRGIDGSPMPAFERETTEAERLAIARYIRTRFLRPDRLLAARLAVELEKAKKDEEFDPKKDWPPPKAKQDVWREEVVADLIESEPCPVPTPFPAPKAGYEQRAAALYNKLGCLGCHGPDGRGTFDPNRKNDNGTVAYPRDLTAGVYKGGPEPEHLYRRIYLGIPGTPMKAFGREKVDDRPLAPDDIVDLVYYVKEKRFQAAPPAGSTAQK